MSRFFGSLIVALALAVPASAGEQDKPAEEQRQTSTTQRKQIRVLQDPKDLASFYRAGGERTQASGPYPLSAYYTNSQGGRGYGYGYGYVYGGYSSRAYRVQDAEPCMLAPYSLAQRYRK
jgi:hypothetical protein